MAKRTSAQKRMVAEALAQMDHPTAAEVYEEIRKAYPQISLGTVYRNLSLMADEGEILRLSFPDAPDRFDPNAHEHYHIGAHAAGGSSTRTAPSRRSSFCGSTVRWKRAQGSRWRTA